MAKQPTKKDLVAAIEKQGIALTGKETVDELKKLVADNSITVEQAQAETGDSVTVKFRDHAGKPTERTFSKEVHGDNFADLADEFKTTHKNRIIDEYEG